MMNLPPVVNTAYVCPNPVPAHVNLVLAPGHPIATTYSGDPSESSALIVDPSGEIHLGMRQRCYRIYFTISGDTTNLNLRFNPQNLLGGDTEFQSPMFNSSNVSVFNALYKNTTCPYYNPHCTHRYNVTVFDGRKFYPLDPHVHNSPPLLVIPIGFAALFLFAALFFGIRLELIPWWRGPRAAKSAPPPAAPSDNDPFLG